ncbi:class I SAM-dependent methyltransferase [Cohnella caldifontis]|uniref:class I SAM-dependent methyltransferase n=1 Tax=Cohnella caldifontis TaxID=3027471 RepID=UPI0023EC3C53|nr:class I SAM-dependent methyltransferase [Cohnella sp. YIM B05605]
MGFVPKHGKEFERQERPSRRFNDYKGELEEVNVKNGAFVLDAGCGSGVVSRYLAERFPASWVIACDENAALIETARNSAQKIPNLFYEEQDLRRLKYPDGHFDLIVSRHVLYRRDPDSLKRILSEFARILTPDGKLVVIETDGG